MKYIVIMLVLLSSLYAKEIAIVKSLDGIVYAKTAQETIELKAGDPLSENMIIQTKDDSGITIVFKDNSFLVLGSNSIMNLEKYVFQPSVEEFEFKLFLKQGSASFESGKIGEMAPESFTFKTPEGTIAIRGTKFLVNVK